jgi:RNA polymerase sporulation-specific sigma factor
MHFRAQRKSSQDVSLSDYIETGGDGGAFELMDVVSSDEDLLEQVSNRQMIQKIARSLDTVLTEQERQVICMRYGLRGSKPCRQREVAKVTGISRSYVSRIEKRALEKLRAELE